jgi:membrane protease YdiL (CAAX protease family)
MGNSVMTTLKPILRFPAVRIVLAGLWVGGAVLIGQLVVGALRLLPGLHGALAGNALALLLMVPATAVAYRAYVRRIERRPVAELARRGAAREAGAGVAFGLGLFGAVIGVLWLLGVYRVWGLGGWAAALAALCGAAASGFIQEVLFRGILLRIIREAWGTGIGLACSALLFGLLHATSAGATVLSVLAIALEAGLLLGAAYLLTGRLWFAVGLHVGWDFANDGLFGTGVAGASGAPVRGLLDGALVGPTYLTGGALGVEVSAVAVVALIVATIALLARYRWGGPARHRRRWGAID